jgi:ligand-binding sensor domain-containing protein/signal transduction histidine kinase
MSFSTSQSLLQDQRGFMWFGTGYGLNKYDGFNFTIYTLETSEDVLAGNSISRLYQDRAGNLWIGTAADLVRMDRETGKFTHYKPDATNPHSLLPGRINTFGEDSSGALWIGTNGGLNRYEPATDTFTRYFENEGVLSFLVDRGGGTWLGTAFGLWYFSPGTLGKQNPVEYRIVPEDQDRFGGNIVNTVFEDQQGAVWAGTQYSGLNRLDRTTGQFTRFLTNPDDPYSLSHNRIWSIKEDDRGRLWIGTMDGLDLFERATGRFYRYYFKPGDPHSLSNDTVWDIYQDRSGVVWFGTTNGVCKVNDVASRFTHYQQGPNPLKGAVPSQPDQGAGSQPGYLPGLSDNIILSVYQDSHGILWVGTSTGGLNRLDRRTGSLKVYQYDPADPDSLYSGAVNAIFEDRAGNLWIGTNGGLDRFNPQTEAFEKESYPEWGGVSSIAEDQQGNLWVGYEAGIRRRKPGASSFTPPQSSGDLPAIERIQAIYPDRRGAVWVSSLNHGLFRLDPAKEGGSAPGIIHFPQDPNDPKSPGVGPVLSFYEDAQGTLWMGSIEDGLVRFDRDSQTFTHYIPAISPARYVHCVQGDAQGFLWVNTRLGLARFDPRSETFIYFDARDGLVAGEGWLCFQNKQGEMFFASRSGLNTFFPDQIRDNPNPPAVVITALNLRDQVLRTDLPADAEIRLSYQENYLSFDFVALDYTAPAKNQYAYKMEGLDANWIEAGTRRHADYPDLQPGTYTFRVKASNNSGVWNEQGAAVRITITPPFWQTWWFLGIVAALMILGVVGAYRLRVRNIETRSLALEEQVRERTSEIEHRRQEMEALYQADEELYRHLHLDNVLQALVDIAVDILHADKGNLLVWDENREYLIPRASHGFKPLTLTNMKLKPGMGIAGKVAVSGKPFMVEDTFTNPDVSRQITDPEGIRSFMQVPIQIKGETFGVFSADYVQPRTFNAQEQRLLIAFAQRAALAIQNAQAYQQEQEMAVLEERSRLARELHDAVTQTLFSASLVAEALPTTWENDPQEGRGLLQELRGLSRGALAEMRTLLLELRPAALVETRLEDLLRQLGEAASGREGIPISVQVEGMAELPPDVQIAFYRITQEALNNIVKHARAHQASVRLCYHCKDQPATSHTTEAKQPQETGLSVLLSISDDGRGFDPTKITHDRLGLGILQERAQAIGATLTIESQPGHGTQVNVLWKQASEQETS